MNILKEVLKYEVFPALGCTEPIAVAFACAAAGKEAEDGILNLEIKVDPGIFKNGFAVSVPNTDGGKGNLIAGALGALIGRPELEMEILKASEPILLEKARKMIEEERAHITYDPEKTDLYLEASVTDGKGNVIRALVESSHTNLVLLEKNGETIFTADETNAAEKVHEKGYKEILKEMRISDFIKIAEEMDDEDYEYVKSGIAMNLEVSQAGRELKKVGYYIANLKDKGLIEDDIFASSKILTASASDARMAGLSYPVMSSGGSGNQGTVAILVPYSVGKYYKISEDKIVRSIALSHLVNSYIKCYTGQLSPLCGCAIAAGVGAAAAIVYQLCGNDENKITLAVNNLISDLGGMLCDGAKGGCALKVASSTDSAIRSAYMALNNHGITYTDGFVGKTAEETILHLSEISKYGMSGVDSTMLSIMLAKTDKGNV
ncbi:MAG: L-serine ammonia-lyase, iron-sulfur-dependent, subunit alpha [Spirochaetia bacterium]|jgi:L-cysteine desulfidase|nr:L-serine ammonia-lyase, iron-sulfur-dependent, subunit alpha [Spirochaetia bacterium]